MSIKNQLKEKSFNKDILYNHVKLFSFPRLAGSEGEKKAVNLTVKTFKDIGFEEKQIEREPFEFSDFYSTTLISLIMIVSFNLILLLRVFIYVFFFYTIIIIVVGLFFFFSIIRGLKHPEKLGFWGEYFGTIFSATNVIVKIPAKIIEESEAGNIIVSAHLDSKSQSFKTCWRIFVYRIWMFSGILLGGFYITIFLYWIGLLFFLNTLPIIVEISIFIEISVWILTFLILFSNLTLMFLRTHNKSPGSLDNASGMAIVFELSSFFKNYPLNNFNLWFCQFSAEELGTMGSRIFVNNNEHQFNKGKVFQINFDMISAAGLSDKRNRIEYLKSNGIYPRKKISPLLSKYLEKAANEENIIVHGFHLSTGAHLDSVPFHLRGYDAIDLSTRWGARWTHNKVDTPDKVDSQILLETCQVARKTILMLDDDYKTLCEKKEIMCDE